jgi:hypothetical protein
MLVVDGEIVPKYGTVGSLDAGSWQEDSGSIYYKPASGAPSGSIVVVHGDSGIGSPPKAVASNTRDYITVRGLTVSHAFVCARFERDSDAAPSASCDGIVIDDCTLAYAVRSNVWVESGTGARLSNSALLYSCDTMAKFGRNVTSATVVNNTEIIGNEFSRSVYSRTDMNSEGHQLDVAQGASGCVVSGNRFAEHGYYAGITEYPSAADSKNRPATTVSLDGVTSCTVTGNVFIDNYVGALIIGNFASIATTAQKVTGNVFDNNWRFASVAGETENNQCTLYVTFAEADVDMLIANNAFIRNGTAAVKAAPTKRGVVQNFDNRAAASRVADVVNNIFYANKIYANVMFGNDAAGGSAVGTLDANLYYDDVTETDSIWWESAGTVRRIDSAAEFASSLQANGIEVNGYFGVNPGLDSDYYASTAYEEAGVWRAGIRMFDDLPAPLRPPIGPRCRRDYPGRRFGVGGAL